MHPAHTRRTQYDAPGRPIRVLVVDDSVVTRRIVIRILAEDPAVEVVGFAANGILALAQEAQLKPDVITMDVEMPEMNGLQAVRELRRRGSTAVIIMCSGLTTLGASSTIDSLMLGANDYVTKASGNAAQSLEGLCRELIPKIKQFFSGELPAAPMRTVLPVAVPALLRTSVARVGFKVEMPRMLVIGVSTGGPTALLDLLPRLPRDFPLPIAIVQHMPPVFTGQLAARLNAQCAIEVVEAADGMKMRPGLAVIAPGDFHLRLKRAGTDVVVRLDQGERENSCRPAVDVLFRSVGEIFGGSVVSLILTGMGQDGLRGVAELKKLGATVIAQDKESSVVWGMPGAVVEAGLADTVLELSEMAPELMRLVRPR